MSRFRSCINLGGIVLRRTRLSEKSVPVQPIRVKAKGEPSLIQRLQRRGFRLFTVVLRTEHVVALTGLMITLSSDGRKCTTCFRQKCTSGFRQKHTT